MTPGAQQLFDSNPRLLVPVGTLLVRGADLPLGTDTWIVDRPSPFANSGFSVPPVGRIGRQSTGLRQGKKFPDNELHFGGRTA